MLQLGKDLGLTPIKCQAKEGTDTLKDIHYRINDILFALTFQYIFQETATEALGKLVPLGKELKDLQVPEKAQPKKDEILRALRTICRSLQGYSNYPQTSDDAEAMQKAVNNLVHHYLKEKDGMDLNTAIAYAVRSKQLCRILRPYAGCVKLTNLERINTEVVQRITKEISVSE